MHGISNGKPAEYIGPWVKIAERGRDQVLTELGGKEPEKHNRACEQAAILISLENLLTFPWIEERVVAGQLRLHGWYFDIAIGQLFSYCPESAAFVQIG